VKKQPVDSFPTSETTRLKPLNLSVPGTRSLRSLSGAASGVPTMLRHLKPRFLEGLTPSALKSVLEAAEYRKVPADSVIIHQDQPAKHLFLLLTGRARYFFVTEKGQKVILLWIPPGEIFGATALLSSPTDYFINTETAQQSSMLVWGRSTIRGLAAQQPKLFENAFYLQLHYMAAYLAAHRALISGAARERLAQVLASIASGIGRKVAGGLELDIRNEELANEANVTLFTTSRLLNEWQRAGILQKSRGKILLSSPASLLRRAI
jgi:CRP-like cAMP-binding protein